MRKLVLKHEHTDVWKHLATEEYLLNALLPDSCILYLWRTADAVVIGKNQNPWLECRFADLDLAGGKLARRLSGGGAVYHDFGNLNFSFILWQDAYDKEALSQIVVDAVRTFGIDASIGDRHVLQADNRKFSGNAFCLRRKKVIHHGTILVDADLERLHEFLRPTCSGIESRGIRSVPSPVVNLSELQPSLTIGAVADAVADQFSEDLCSRFQVSAQQGLQTWSAQIRELRRQRYDDPAWHYRH